MRDIVREQSGEAEAAERPPRTREEFYLQQIDGRTRARKRAVLGAITAALLALAVILPAAAPWLLFAALFSGLGIGWVE